MDNENNKDYLNEEKGEFIVNKKIDEEVKNETNKIEEKGEFIVNKKPIEEESSNIKEDNNTNQDENINTSYNYEQNNNFNNQNSYNFEEEMQKIKDKNKKKNKKIIGFSIAGVLIIALIACFIMIGGTPSYEDYANYGIEVNENFEITPEDFSKAMDYTNENVYFSEFSGTTIPLIGDVTFNDEKNYYEKIIDDSCDFKMILYPSDDHNNIEKIEFSYNWMDFSNKNDKEYEEILNILSAYVNITQGCLWGDENYTQEINNNMWDKLNSLEYKPTADGMPSGSISHIDDKATYTREVKGEYEYMIITPNK